MTVSGNIKESKPRNVKDTWESELGYGWTRSGQRRCRIHRPPESTMSVSSDIRFTRRKLSRPCRGCCAALAALLVLLLLAAVAVYLGHMYLFGDPLNRQTFRGSFVVSAWEGREGRDPAPTGNRTREADLRQALFDLYRNSELRSCFVAADILALDSADDGVRVHFELSFEPIFTAVSTTEVTAVLTRELESPTVYLEYVTTLPETLHIEIVNIKYANTLSPRGSEEVFHSWKYPNSTIVIFGPLNVKPRSCSPCGFAHDVFLHRRDKYLVMNIYVDTQENSVISSQALKEAETTSLETPTTGFPVEVEEEVRECSPVTLTLCSHLPYNSTTYPNLVGHTSKDALLRDLVAFRELLDAECSHLAQDFVCQMLQPRCDQGRLVRPCRAYCRVFHAGCGSRLPDRLKPHFDCSRFPNYFGPDSCATEPGCNAGLQRLALSRRSCDGIPDCADAEDERECAHCAAAGRNGLRCAMTARCLPPHLRCDGTPDCADGSDESGCLWVSRSLASWRRENAETTLGAIRSRAGYAVWAERGRAGKVCAAPYENDKRALSSFATSLCKALTYRKNETWSNSQIKPAGTHVQSLFHDVAFDVSMDIECYIMEYFYYLSRGTICSRRAAISVEVVPDAEEESDDEQNRPTKGVPEYVEVVDPFAPEISFLKTECPQRKVIRVVCEQLECGVASARGARAANGVDGLPRSAQPGDWPWHAALLRSHVHACDAALVHPSWLITTASCFQGQPKAEWTARLGTVRIQSTTPWQQEQRIVGMVRSPVEGSMLALVRLEEPVEMTDFVRPACLPESGTGTGGHIVCNTLGWTRNRDQLQRVHVVTSPMHNCENVSIATVNGICAEPLYDQDDCDEEEYAGSSMMCFDDVTKHWSLMGVSGWRIACSKIGLGRPRIYDAITSHIDWIRRTIFNAAR